MMDKYCKSSVFKDVIYFFLGSVFGRFFSVILTPFLAITLSPAELGEYDMIISTLLIVTPFMNLQLNEGQLLYSLKEKKPSKSIYTSLVFSILTSLIGSISSYIILEYLTYKYSFVVSLLIFFVSMWPIVLTIFRSKNQSFLYALFSSLVTPILLIYLYATPNFNIERVLQGLVLSYSIIIIPIILFNINKYNFSFELLKKIIRYSYPFIFNTLFWWIQSIALRYLLIYFDSIEIVGKFAVDFKIASIIILISNVLYMTQQNNVFTLKTLNINFNPYILLIVLSLLIAITAPIFVDYFLPDFFLFNKSSFILIASAMFQGFAIFEGVKYQISFKSIILLKSNIISSILGVIIAIPLISIYSELGAAISLLISNIILFLTRKFFYNE